MPACSTQSSSRTTSCNATPKLTSSPAHTAPLPTVTQQTPPSSKAPQAPGKPASRSTPSTNSTNPSSTSTPSTSAHRIDFTAALLTLVAELAFAAVPISFNVAWRTTRIATNRGLHHIRRFAGDHVLAVVMSCVHWLVRGAPERLMEFVISVETFTFVAEQIADRAQELEELDPMTVQEVYTAMADAVPILRDVTGENISLDDGHGGNLS